MIFQKQLNCKYEVLNNLMEEIFFVCIVLVIISSIEFTSLVFYFILKRRSRKSQGIQITRIQNLFLVLALILFISRILSFVIMFIREEFLYEILIGVHYLATVSIYFLIGYSWYTLFRLSIYLSNLFHIPESDKALILHRAKYLIISLDVLLVLSFSLVLGFDYKPISFEVLGKSKPISSVPFRIHQLSSLVIIYIYLTVIGGLLLRQISKYYTKKPIILIFSLYLIIADFTLAVTITTLQIFKPKIFSPEI